MAIAVAVLFLAGMLTVAFLYAVTAEPFIAGVASRLLGRQVEIDSAELQLGSAPGIELRGVRVFETRQGEGRPVLEIPRARGIHRWPQVLAGGLLPRRWIVEDPRLHLQLGNLFDDQGRQGGIAPSIDLTVLRGTVELEIGYGAPLLLEDLSCELTRSPLRGEMEGKLGARVSRAGRPVGRFSASFDGRLDNGALDGRIEELDLAALPPDGSLQGMAEASLTIEYDGTQLAAELDLDAGDVVIRAPGLKRPIRPTRAHLGARLAWRPGLWTIEPRPLQLDDLEVAGRLEIRSGSSGRVRGRLELADFSPGRPAGDRLNLISLLGRRHKIWEDANRRIEKGWVKDFSIELDLPLRGIEDALSFKRRLEAHELRIQGRTRGGTYRPHPDSEPLEDLSSSFAIIGNVLQIRELTMTRGGHALPRVDVEVDGMHRLVRLPSEERGTPKGPGVPIPGLGPATSGLRGARPDDAPPTRVLLSNFQVGHGAFVLQVRDATAQLRFPEGKLVVEEARGVVGGVPAEIEATWDREASTVDVLLRYGDEQAEPWEGPGSDWFSGDFELQTLYLDKWRVDDVQGQIRGQADQVQFPEIRGSMGGGSARAQGWVSLGEQGFAPFAFETEVSAADARAANYPLGLEEETLRGTASMRGVWKGQLQPDHSYLEHADAVFETEFRDGAIGNLPARLVLARLPSLQGIRGLFGRPLPFATADASFTLQEGLLRTEDLSLVGPELRVLAAGQVDLLSEEKTSDLLLALLFLETVDRMIERLPILGEWMLGDDKSLVTLYLRLDGPWENPRARVVPPAMVQTAAGWAGKIVAAGARQLLRILTLGASRSEEDTDESESQGPGPQP
jgi:hypothetical protein